MELWKDDLDQVKRLAITSDVLLEIFIPQSQSCYHITLFILIHSLVYVALEKWGLGPANLHPLNPELRFTRGPFLSLLPLRQFQDIYGRGS